LRPVPNFLFPSEDFFLLSFRPAEKVVGAPHIDGDTRAVPWSRPVVVVVVVAVVPVVPVVVEDAVFRFRFRRPLRGRTRGFGSFFFRLFVGFRYLFEKSRKS